MANDSWENWYFCLNSICRSQENVFKTAAFDETDKSAMHSIFDQIMFWKLKYDPYEGWSWLMTKLPVDEVVPNLTAFQFN